MFFPISVWLRYTVQMDGLISSEKRCAASWLKLLLDEGSDKLSAFRLLCPLYILISGMFINLKYQVVLPKIGKSMEYSKHLTHYRAILILPLTSCLAS